VGDKILFGKYSGSELKVADEEHLNFPKQKLIYGPRQMEARIDQELLYIAAEKGQLPELKRVIVGFGDRIAMEETLEGGRPEGAIAVADVATCRVIGRGCGTTHSTEWECLRSSTRANSQ